MKKPILLFLILIMIPLTYAQISIDPEDYIFADFGDQFKNGTDRNTPADEDLLTTVGYKFNTNSAKYDDDGFQIGNMSMFFQGSAALRLNTFDLGFNYSVVTCRISMYDTDADDTGEFIVKLKDVSGNIIFQYGFKSSVTDTNYFYNNGAGDTDSTFTRRQDDWTNYTLEMGSFNSYSALFMQDTLINNKTTGFTGFGSMEIFAQNKDATMDNILCWNETRDKQPITFVDTTKPRVNSSINDTTPKINEHILISANVTDETDLGDCVFSTNQTGGTDETIAVSGTADTCEQNFTISMSRNNVINFTILIDDGTNFNQSSHIITISNTLPNQAVIVNATDGIFNKNITINITPSIDADSDTLTYSWYINGSLVATGTTTTSIITNQTDGLYNVSVDVTDGVGTIIGGSWFFSIDTTFPVLTITQPINNTIYAGDIPIDITCNDNNLFRLNYTFTNGTILKSVENNTPGASEIQIVDTINSTAFTDNTNFLLNIECADTHTKKKIKDYQVIKDDDKKELKFRTDKQKLIYIESENKQDVTFFFSYKEGDRYKFNYYFDNALGTYSFRLRANNLIYLPNSEYNGHFITKENWIDFNLDDKKAIYKITKIYDDEYRIEITTELQALEFNSIGDLNIVTAQLNLSINNTPVIVVRTPLPLETPINVVAMLALLFIVIIFFSSVIGGRKK